MAIYSFPKMLEQVAHFTLSSVQTWGSSKDQEYKALVREVAGLRPDIQEDYEWFSFSTRCVVGLSRGKVKKQIPDVENIPKLIVDAFTKVLYPDDHIHYVRGIQVEAVFGPDAEEKTEVWIFGQPKVKGS